MIADEIRQAVLRASGPPEAIFLSEYPAHELKRWAELNLPMLIGSPGAVMAEQTLEAQRRPVLEFMGLPVVPIVGWPQTRAELHGRTGGGEAWVVVIRL